MRLLCFLLLACCTLLAPIAQARPLDRVEAVQLTSPAGGVRLGGLMRLPTGTEPFAAAVLLPERGTDERNPLSPDNLLLTSIADQLVSKGMIVLRLHERGNGGSEGQATATTLAERATDAIAALNYLRTQPQVDVTRLGLIGHGEGANVALLAASQPQASTFVVAVAAAGLTGRELLANQPVVYGKVLGRDTLEVHQQHIYRLAKTTAQTEVTRLRAQGSNSAQVQTYLDQQHLRLKATQRRDQEARVKHQRAMLEIVRQMPDNAQAQAILSNMLRQRYPAIATQDVQASVQSFTTPTYRSYLAFDPLPTLPQVHCPVLLMQGDDDPEVNAATNLSLLKKGLHDNPGSREAGAAFSYGLSCNEFACTELGPFAYDYQFTGPDGPAVGAAERRSLQLQKKDDEAGGPGGKGGKDGGPTPIKDYPVLVVKPDTVTLFQDYPATIQGQQNVEIRPKVDGFVEAIYVDEGASVKKSQKLFHISAPQYEQEVRTARAGIKTAQADVDAARMGVAKVAPLVAQRHHQQISARRRAVHAGG